jgi:hypothetical protein
MRNIVTCIALGLSITAGSLAIATPASAFVFWNLKAEQAGKPICMGVSGGDPQGHVTAGTHIIVWDCNYSNDQVWNWNVDALNFVDAVTDSAGNSMCLNDTGDSPTRGADRGAQVTISECTGAYIQEFGFFPLGNPDADGDQCGNIFNYASGRVVGVANAEVNPVKDGMSVIMWDYNGSTDQIWCMHPNPVIHVD